MRGMKHKRIHLLHTLMQNRSYQIEFMTLLVIFQGPRAGLSPPRWRGVPHRRTRPRSRRSAGSPVLGAVQLIVIMKLGARHGGWGEEAAAG
jgi:hypothetical protein